MAKMGIGGLLLGAAALAAASAVTSDSNRNRVIYDKYDIEHDVDGNELTDNEMIIKSIIKWGTIQSVNQNLQKCVTSKGRVDQGLALGKLVEYLYGQDCVDYLIIKKGFELDEINECIAGE